MGPSHGAPPRCVPPQRLDGGLRSVRRPGGRGRGKIFLCHVLHVRSPKVFLMAIEGRVEAVSETVHVAQIHRQERHVLVDVAVKPSAAAFQEFDDTERDLREGTRSLSLRAPHKS